MGPLNPEFPGEEETPAKGTREASLRGSSEQSFVRSLLGSLVFLAWGTVSFIFFSDHDPWWPFAGLWLLFGLLAFFEYRARIGKGGRFSNLLTRKLW